MHANRTMMVFKIWNCPCKSSISWLFLKCCKDVFKKLEFVLANLPLAGCFRTGADK
jgi:hypothetical protein